jgi:hypothetical protein
MIKYALLFVLTFLLIMCDKKATNEINEFDNIETAEFNKIIEICVSGNYGWNMDNYLYEIKKVENKYILSVDKIYGKILSYDIIDNIYNYIYENEMELEIKTATGWCGDHDFYGSIFINIDNKIYENEIHSTQDYENNLYKILNFLNDLIENKYYYMPIYGVGEYGVAQGRGRYNRK